MSAIALTVRIVAIVLLTWASLRFKFLLPLDRREQLIKDCYQTKITKSWPPGTWLVRLGCACGAVYLIVSTVMALVQS